MAIGRKRNAAMDEKKTFCGFCANRFLDVQVFKRLE